MSSTKRLALNPESKQDLAHIPAFRMFTIDEAARRASLNGDDVIYLTLGKSDLPLHPEIVATITRAVGDPCLSTVVFPGGLPELRECLADRYSDLVGEPISPARILVDAGTSNLYPNLYRVLGAAGHEVLIPKPYYPLYRVAATLAGAQVSYYDIDLRTMRIDLESLKNSIGESTRVVVVNSPGNPLGNLVTRNEMEQLLMLLPEDAFLVFDEIYENVSFADIPPLTPTLLRSSEPWSSRTVITNSCSKSYRMYAKRVGWCVLPHALSRVMLSILQHIRLTVDPAVQYGAIEALRRDDEVATLRSIHFERWKYALEELSTLPSIRLLPSAGGFYCTLECAEFARRKGLVEDSALALDILNRSGVATVPGEDFGLPGTLRLSFTSKRFKEAVRRLATYFCNESGPVDLETESKHWALP